MSSTQSLVPVEKADLPALTDLVHSCKLALSINRLIIRPLFLLPFLGTGLLCVALFVACALHVRLRQKHAKRAAAANPSLES